MTRPRILLAVLVLALVAVGVTTGSTVWEWVTTEGVVMLVTQSEDWGGYRTHRVIRATPTASRWTPHLIEGIDEFYAWLGFDLWETIPDQFTRKVRTRVHRWRHTPYHAVIHGAVEVTVDGLEIFRGAYVHNEWTGVWTAWDMRGRVVGQVDFSADPETILTDPPWLNGVTDQVVDQ